MYLTFYYSQGEVIIFEGVKITETRFGQNFEAIFRDNGGLSEHGTTPVINKIQSVNYMFHGEGKIILSRHSLNTNTIIRLGTIRHSNLPSYHIHHSNLALIYII